MDSLLFVKAAGNRVTKWLILARMLLNVLFISECSEKWSCSNITYYLEKRGRVIFSDFNMVKIRKFRGGPKIL